MGGLDRTRAPGTLALAALAFTPLPAGSASRAYLGIGKWIALLEHPAWPDDRGSQFRWGQLMRNKRVLPILDSS